MNLNFICKITRIKIFFIKKQEEEERSKNVMFYIWKFQKTIYLCYIYVKPGKLKKNPIGLPINIYIRKKLLLIFFSFTHQFVIV